MKTLQLTIATIFTFIATMTFANDPYFIVEEENDNYVMYLQIDDATAFSQIEVQGSFCVNGVTENTVIEMEGSALGKFEANAAKIHTLDKSCDYANYTVQVTDANGDVWAYPTVLIHAENYDMAMAAK